MELSFEVVKEQLSKLLDNFDDEDAISALLCFIIQKPDAVKKFVDLYHDYVLVQNKLLNWFDGDED